MGSGVTCRPLRRRQVWMAGGGNAWALKLYLAQLALNFLWPIVSLAAHK